MSRLIEILKEEGIREVVMAGQVKHAKIFSSIRPDWRLIKLLASLPAKNTDGLIGGVAKVLADEGIQLRDSTALLKPLLADRGAMTRRKPDAREEADIAYGRKVAAALAGFDVGQSVAICERACVALEAMEGTDALLRRAAALVNGRPLTLVKVSNRRRHLLFDVPVAGLDTIAVMRETGTTVLAVDAGRTLLLDREQMLARADEPESRSSVRYRRIPACIRDSRWSAPVSSGRIIAASSGNRRARNWPRWWISIPRAARTADYRELAGKVDAAIVAAPTSAHAEIGCWLLEHGIDVLVEKPIAPDLESADRLHRGCRAARPHAPGGPSGALQSGGDRARRPRHAAACSSRSTG